MAKSSAFETQLLKLLFNAVTIPGIADNTATSPNTVLYVALHTADPGTTGTQATNEIAYTGYARVPVNRDTTGFTVTGNSVSPAINIDFPTGTGGSGTAAYFSIGLQQNGAGEILYSGAITPTIACGNGVTPRLSTSSTISET